MTDVAILIPVLRRPHRVEPLLASIDANTAAGWRAVFICDPDDFPEQEAVAASGADRLLVAGNYAEKINAAARVAPEQLLLLAADDLAFHPSWLPRALEHMTGRIGVVGTNDLGNPRVLRGEHATHSLVARWYADLGTIDETGPGKILHEGYPHEFVDDEFIGTAKKRRAFAFARDSVVEHLHPHWGKAPTDELYDAEPERMRAGHKLYRRRRRLWR